MADDKTEIVIVRRGHDEAEEHHGGVWKIALADFMTTMMALFLVLWLSNVAPRELKASIANYFNPITLSAALPTRKGLNDPDGSAMSTVGSSATGGGDPNNEGEGGPRGGTTLPRTVGEAPVPAVPGSPRRERELFQDPYAILAKLAAATEGNAPSGAQDVSAGKSSRPDEAAVRDPFDPLYWHILALSPAKAPATSSLPPGEIDARGPRQLPGPQSSSGPETDVEPAAAAAAPGEAAPPSREASPAKAGQAAAKAGGTDAAAGIADQLSGIQGPQVEVKRSGKGILISVTDDLAFSMFDVGSAQPQPRTVKAMEAVAKVLAGRPGRIVIRGHTDARPFRSAVYDNWRLSTARAHMAAYMLIRAGVGEDRIRRIEGYASGAPRNAADPYAAENRRIEILLEEPPR